MPVIHSFLPIQVFPYFRAIRRFLAGHPGKPQDIAAYTEVLCPEEEDRTSAAIYLPGQLDQLTEYSARERWTNATTKTEVILATSATTKHAPTIAYHIENAVLFDGSIYCSSYRHPIADKSLFNSPSGRAIHLKKVALISSYLGTKFFGHWMTDDCASYLLTDFTVPPLCVRMPAFPDAIKYQDYFGQVWAPTDRAWINHLILYQDFAPNSHKRRRFEILRERVRARFPNNGRDIYVYIKRGKTGAQRIVSNEDEIMAALTKRGFKILEIGLDNLEYILKNIVNAKIIISMEGSHYAHSIFAMSVKSALLVLQPSDRFSSSEHVMANAINARSGFVVGTKKVHGYHFSIDDILHTADLLLNEINA